MKPTTFHVELTAREMGLVQASLNAAIMDCDTQIGAANKRHDTTALAYYTRRRVQVDMLHDKLHAALHATTPIGTIIPVTVTPEVN